MADRGDYVNMRIVSKKTFEYCGQLFEVDAVYNYLGQYGESVPIPDMKYGHIVSVRGHEFVFDSGTFWGYFTYG